MRRRPISLSPWEPGACTRQPPWRRYYNAMYPVIQSHEETGSIRILSRVRFGSEPNFSVILTRSEHKTGSLLALTLTAAQSRITISEAAQSVTIQAVKDDIYIILLFTVQTWSVSFEILRGASLSERADALQKSQ